MEHEMFRYDIGMVFSVAVLFAAPAVAGPIAIDLGTAGSFAVLAGSTVANTGPTTVNGDLGVWPGTSITGFLPGVVVNGGIYDGDTVAMQAQADALTAFSTAAAETGAQSLTGQDLGGLNLTAGVYSFASSAQLTGTLTLNAQGSQNAVFIFQIGSTLTTASNAQISVINGQAAEIFWQVGSSATLGTGTEFDGDIIALASITLDTGATVSCGGALALNGAVSMDTNTVSTTGAACPGQTQVPEPASLFILVAGFSTILTARARRDIKVTVTKA